MRTVIHRDMTLSFNGETYGVLAGGSGWGYLIHDHAGVEVADAFFTLAEVRDYVDKARAEGWERLGEDR
jgi:hypothetical protein